MTSGSDTLHGRCILVTGGARRVGAAIVRELAEAGADVVIHCRQSQREAEALATWVRGRTRSAWVVSGDLADSSALDPLMDHVLALTNGRLDGLVNNASSYPASRVRTLQANDLAASVHLHGFAPLALARRLAAAGRPGSVVNVLDARITMYDADHVAYHLGKRMLDSVTRMLALELAPRIRVNAVAPGAVLQKDTEDETALERLSAFNPLRMHGSPAGVATCVRFLLATDFITGQTLFYDGGYHLKAATYG